MSVMGVLKGGNVAVVEVLRSSGDVEYMGFRGIISARRQFDVYRQSPCAYNVEALVLYGDRAEELVSWTRTED